MKKLLLFTLTITVIAIAGLLIAIAFVDINDYKDQIAAHVKTTTGHDLVINGNMKLSILPDIALKLPKTELTKTTKNGKKITSFSADMVKLHVQLKPLLDSQIIIEELSVKKPEITVLIDQDNQSNWSFPPSTTEKKESDKPLTLKFNKIHIENGRLQYQNQNDSPFTAENIQLNVTVNKENSHEGTLSLSTLLHQGKKKLGQLKIKSPYSHEDYKNFHLQKTTISFDELSAQGKIDLDLRAEPANIRTSLVANTINLDRLLDTEKSTKKENKKNTPFAWDTSPITLAALESLNIDINLKADEIIYSGISLNNSDIDAHFRPQKLSATINQSSLMEGTLKGQLSLDTKNTKIAKISSSLELDHINLEQAFTSLGKKPRISGYLSGKTKLLSSGSSQKNLVEELQGDGQFKVEDGRIKNLDLLAMVKNIATAFKKGPQNTHSKDSSFEFITGSYQIDKGIIQNNNLVLNSTTLGLGGEGKINLPDYSIDYRLTPKIANNTFLTLVPILIQGRLDSPLFLPDLLSPVKGLAASPENVKDLVKDVKESTQKGLKSITNQIPGIGKKEEPAPDAPAPSPEEKTVPTPETAEEKKEPIKEIENILKGF